MPKESKLSLLLQRMKEFEIPEWPGEAVFEEVLLYCLPDEGAASETFSKDGMIVKPDTRKAIDIARSPRGIVVSAGLKAMDIMDAHGMQVGELVWFAPHVPYRFEVGRNEKGPILFMFMNVADIKLSEDVPTRLANGDIVLTKNSKGEHVYAGKDRVDPTLSPDAI